MTFHQIRIFSAIARRRNVTKAAGDLRISQPSVTYQLKLLQEEFGLKLYRKNPRGIGLTADGRSLLEEIEPIMRQMEVIKAKFGQTTTGTNPGALIIGGSNGPSSWFLPSLASRFRETHPDVQITLRLESSLTLEEMVQNGEIEIAVVTAHSNSSRLTYEHCRQEKTVFFAPPEVRFPRPELSMAELAQTPLILFKRGKAGATAQLLNQMAKAGIRANVAMRCESVDAVKNAVQSGMGLGMLYR